MTSRTDAIMRAVSDEVALRLAHLDQADAVPEAVRVVLYFNTLTGFPRRVQTQIEWQHAVGPGDEPPPARRTG